MQKIKIKFLKALKNDIEVYKHNCKKIKTNKYSFKNKFY